MVIGSRILRKIALACVAGAITLGTALATQVRLVNVDELTRKAARIFAGRCLEVVLQHDPQVGGDITVATFEVLRSVKGGDRGTVTLRLAGGDDTRGDDPLGAPRFSPGDEVILFLYGESAEGLTSPVGLGQGRFRIMKDKAGREVAINDFANKNLLLGLTPGARAHLAAGLPSTTDDAGALKPDTLMDLAAALTDAGD